MLRMHVRRVPAIDPEGPYDDTIVEGSLALALPLPEPEPVAPLRLVPDEEEAEADEFDPVRTPRADLPPPGPRAEMLVRALLEVLAGDRPVTQLARWTTPKVYEQIEGMLEPRGPRPWAGTLRGVHVTEPADGVAEVAAIVRRGPRSGAVALRLEGLDGRWLVTAVQVG